MRSRSSRLFIVLLHLVGVSTNLPGNSFLAALFNSQTGMGIVGVHPLAIILEPLELRAAGGLEELLNIFEGSGYNVDDTLLGEPYWFQDDTDGKCLGPAGFSECGDATLWKIRRRPRKADAKCTSENGAGEKCPRNRFFSFFRKKRTIASKDEGGHKWEYAFELFDQQTGLPSDLESGVIDQTKQFENVKEDDIYPPDEVGAECMVPLPFSDFPLGGVGVGECTSDRAWSWTISEDGALQWDGKKVVDDVKQRSKYKKIWRFGKALNQFDEQSSKKGEITPYCLSRVNSSIATTKVCMSDDSMDNEHHTYVRFSVIQYQSSGIVSPRLPSSNVTMRKGTLSLSNSTNNVTINQLESHFISNVKIEERDDHSHLPRTRRTSQDHASKVLHPELKTASALVFRRNAHSLSQSRDKTTSLPGVSSKISSPSGVGYVKKMSIEAEPSRKDRKILHHPHSLEPAEYQKQAHKDTPHRPRKIPIHPYIEASKNGVYEDPLTGLTYQTDLSTYLGHDRKLSGRHTLMGVGIYYRTMLKIKVYGVALYVPKRDVLADAGFDAFASLNLEELRKSDEFYDYLMGTTSVDKTLFIKTNMQLSVENIRGSLESDWKLLLPDHKKMLTDSTFKLRHTDDRMLQTIMNKENTSKCSCGQKAPDSYQADSTCCARGTELVFTWRKNGNLELRVDGRIIDVLPNPDIARGIFYEYLRGDDPISVDARDHFADGFPFLLAPLSQVKGISSPLLGQQQDSPPEPKMTGTNGMFGLGNMYRNALNLVNSQANEFSDWIQLNIQGGRSNVANTSRFITSVSKKVGSEIDRTRINIWVHVMDFPEHALQFFTHRSHNMKADALYKVTPSKRIVPVLEKERKYLLGSLLTNRQISDEIGVVVDPSRNFTHMLYLIMVHFYLLLLLIVSVPDSYTIRLVVKRPSTSSIRSDKDSDLCKSMLLGQVNLNGTIEVMKEEINSKQGTEVTNGNKMKKALSYYL